jgi:hypothetical protein
VPVLMRPKQKSIEMPVYIVFVTPLTAKIIEEPPVGMFHFGGSMWMPKFETYELAEAYCAHCGIAIIK